MQLRLPLSLAKASLLALFCSPVDLSSNHLRDEL